MEDVCSFHFSKFQIILILISQLTDESFGKSYTTMSSQKPLYKTRFLLDELGNLQSEGKGITNFQTLLSIGLGQDQQFVLILQTMNTKCAKSTEKKKRFMFLLP